MTRGNVRVSISSDTSGLKKGVRDSEQQLTRLQRVGVSSGRGLGVAFKAAGAVVAGAAIADQIQATVKAAEEAEVSQRKLQAQLKASGISYAAHAKEIDKVIQATSRLSGLDDEDLQDAFTNIIRVTGNVNKSLKLTGLAADFARAKHMDVAKAGEIVGKVAGGNIGILSRYGIQIDKGATSTEALGKLQKKFAGQAKAYGETSAGAQDRFKVAVENLREALGKKLLPIIAKVADKAATFIDQMSTGEGAGGRFAAKLKDVGERLKPIAKFFGDHPKLIAVAVGAWAAYRLAAVAALAATRAKLIGQFIGLGPRAAKGGAVAGAEFGAAANATSSAEMRRFKWRALGTRIGALVAIGIGLALTDKLQGPIHDLAQKLADLVTGVDGRKLKAENAKKFAAQGHLAAPPVKRQILGTHKTLPPAKSGAGSHPAEGKAGHRARGASTTITASAVMARTAAVSTGGAQPNPDDIVAAITERANQIDSAHVPYLWGGGHGGRFTGKVIPMDCSGAVSAALGIDPRVSGQFVTWGSPGDGGNRGVTVYANSTHVLMKINGRFWGTSRSNPGGGPGWIEGGVSAGYLSRFTARHMEGATGATAALARSSSGAVTKPKQPSAADIAKALAAPVVRRLGVTQGRRNEAARTSAGFAATADTMIGQIQRRNDLTQEDLDTPGGRINRIFELQPIARLQTQKAFALANQRNAILSKVKGYRQAIAGLTRRMRGATKAVRKQLASKISHYQRLIRQAKAQAAQLGFDIGDAMIDLQATQGEISDAYTGPAPDATDAGTVTGIDAIPGASGYLASLDKAGALAALTPETTDDIAVAQANVTARENILAYEQSTPGFSDTDIADAARALKSDRDALDALTTAVGDLNDTNQQQLAVAQAQLDLEKQRNTDLQRALNVSQSQYGIFKQWMAGVVSGEVGGRIGLGFQTPSYAGGVAKP